MSVPVKEAARLLGVSERRVRQLLNDGVLQGDRFGESWQVSAPALARLQSQRRHRGRPLGPGRSWALLDLLEGGSASWLRPSARSQLRSSLGRFVDADDDRWRSALHGRSDVIRCVAHPAAVDRLLALPDVLSAGAGVAANRGFDLVAGNAVPEAYLLADEWPDLARSLAIRPAIGAAEANLIVRLPLVVWPFAPGQRVSIAALAADLLESPEPRAVSAGVMRLNDLLAALIGGERR